MPLIIKVTLILLLLNVITNTIIIKLIITTITALISATLHYQRSLAMRNNSMYDQA